MKNFVFKREWMDEMVELPDDFRARIILAANDYAYFSKRPEDPIVAYAMRHIIAYIDKRNAAEIRKEKQRADQLIQSKPNVNKSDIVDSTKAQDNSHVADDQTDAVSILSSSRGECLTDFEHKEVSVIERSVSVVNSLCNPTVDNANMPVVAKPVEPKRGLKKPLNGTRKRELKNKATISYRDYKQLKKVV